ncbi:hypothetical protein F506_09105 [Herbaspirillum hiltneri N3]|uniref:Indolepyruvate ferredoxin oxidoreductase n=1 Tax=Herbaspirillum hiltneri N3 TaxID=1262470 RepID=A0ABM5V005_9BURK|nr:hypothetical protein F506_09105 [Herbaspirillum hiltneri N3]
MSGIQALVRLPLLQYLRDQKAGLNTAGFISGYRGSPLGGLDEALWKAQPHLDAHKIRFQPGTNEDMAATAVNVGSGCRKAPMASRGMALSNCFSSAWRSTRRHI